jgi:hypothetical protein
MHTDVLADLTSCSESGHSQTEMVLSLTQSKRMTGNANVGKVLVAVNT